MAIEYLGLSEINGPLVVLEGVKNASYEEIVEFHMTGLARSAVLLRFMRTKLLFRFSKELTACP